MHMHMYVWMACVGHKLWTACWARRTHREFMPPARDAAHAETRHLDCDGCAAPHAAVLSEQMHGPRSSLSTVRGGCAAGLSALATLGTGKLRVCMQAASGGLGSKAGA
jgi:hypothetical protein